MARRAPPPTQAPLTKAPRTDAPQSAPFPLSALPRDLLPLVLRRLPHDHRLRHASRVCKTWRTIILSTTGELKLILGQLSRPWDQLSRLFPALTSLSIRCEAQCIPPPHVLHLPTSLKSLRLVVDAYRLKDYPLQLSPLSSLTHLSYDYDHPDPLVALVAASASSLRSLETSLIAPIRHTRLPSLTSLVVKDDSRDSQDLPFLLAHSTQLYRLSLRYQSVDHLSSVDLPLLTSLTCLHPAKAAWDSVFAPVARHRLLHSTLRQLTVVCSNADCPPSTEAGDVAALLAPVLTSLEVTSHMEARFRTECLPLFTRLERLVLPTEEYASLELPAHCIAAVKHLALGMSGRRLQLVRPALARFGCITSLSLHGVPKDWASLLALLSTDLSLPCLTSLLVSGVPSLGAATSIVSKFKFLAPRLRKCTVKPQPGKLDRASHAEVVALCHACEGLSVLKLQPDSELFISSETTAYLYALPLRVLVRED